MASFLATNFIDLQFFSKDLISRCDLHEAISVASLWNTKRTLYRALQKKQSHDSSLKSEEVNMFTKILRYSSTDDFPF